jgi:MYXO-CTERM domain-containing protein
VIYSRCASLHRLRFAHTVGGAALLLYTALASPAQAATLQVGPGKTYAKPCQAIAAAAAGDLIEIDPGTYAGDTCAWSTDNLTVRGKNGRPKLDLAGVQPAQQKGLFTIAAANATIENLEFTGAAISAAAGNNGAGIRHQGANLTVRGCYFHDNQNGILGAPATANTGLVLIENSEFEHNGAGDGFSHNMYIGNYAHFILRYSYSHRGNVGHLVKSRAYLAEILYNRITDESGGTASYEVDLPNAGTAYVVGNVIEQSAGSQNPAMVEYGEEGTPAGYDTHLYVINNTLLNNLKSGTFVANTTTTPGTLTNNIFWNGGTVSSQSTALQTSNFVSATMGDPLFASVTSFDVHLLSGSPCIDQGTAPGSANGQALQPVFQYVHPRSQEVRGIGGSASDIGAYEFNNPVGTPDGMAGNPGDMAGNPGGMAGGCSCQLTARPASAVGAYFTLAGLLLLRMRRRRRATS